MGKRIFSVILAAVMVGSLLGMGGMTTYADDVTVTEEDVEAEPVSEETEGEDTDVVSTEDGTGNAAETTEAFEEDLSATGELASEETDAAEEIVVKTDGETSSNEDETSDSLDEGTVLDEIATVSSEAAVDEEEEAVSEGETVTGTALATEVAAETESETSLADMISSADSGDTITLTSDEVLSSAITISKNLTIDLGGYSVSYSGSTGTEDTKTLFKVSSGYTVTFKNGTMKGLGKEEMPDEWDDSELSGGTHNLRAVYASGKAYINLSGVTFENFWSAGNGGAVYVSDSNRKATLEIDNCVFKNCLSYYVTSSSVVGNGGGAVYAKWCSKVDIRNTSFNDCKTFLCGGALSFSYVSAVNMENDTIKGCSADSDYADQISNSTTKSFVGSGGAIVAYAYSYVSKLNIASCTIEENAADAYGGAVFFYGYSYGELMSNEANTDAVITITATTLDGNSAGTRGGAIKMYGGTLTLVSGSITDNSAYIGGGIDYTTHTATPLELTNVLITGNTALRGGGIWLCPSSTLASYSTLGGAIYGNTALGSYYANGYVGASGDDVVHEGTDSNDYLATVNWSKSSSSIVSVSSRALGGGLMSWYDDGEDVLKSAVLSGGCYVTADGNSADSSLLSNRYESGDEETEASTYTNTALSFRLHGELENDLTALAEEEAAVIISGNKATLWGGGIASNADTVIGESDQDVSVTVTKSWDTSDGGEVPGSILVDLYRIDASGNQVRLDTGVELTSEGGWTYTFTGLPSKYLDDDGETKDYSYTVVEQDVSGWTSGTTASSYDGDTSAWNITITNVPVETGSILVEKTVSGTAASTTEVFEFTMTLSDTSINGEYGELTFTDGVAGFELKAGEDVTVSDIPEGTVYEVVESGSDGYTVTVPSGNSKGTIEADKTITVIFNNHKDKTTSTTTTETTETTTTTGSSDSSSSSSSSGSSTSSSSSTSAVSSASTGDSVSIVFWLAIAVIAVAAGVAVTLVYRKKHAS